MQILEIKGKKWMVGIEWEILPGDSTVKLEAKEVAEKTNSKFGVVIDYDSTYAIGLTKKVSKDPSAALYLAIANQLMRESNSNSDYPDWVVLEEVGDEKYWMGVVKSGIPAPQFDAILSITEVKERITELLINDTYSIYSSAGELISIFEGIKNIEKRSLSDLTDDVSTKIKFEKLLGIPNYVYFAAAGLGVFVLVAYGALQFVNGLTLKEKAQYLAQKEQRERDEKQAKYNQDLKDYTVLKEKSKVEEVSKIVSALSGNPSKILGAFYSSVGSVDGGTSGWKLTSIECYYDVLPSSLAVAAGAKLSEYPKLACDYLYERTGLSTTRMLLEDYPTAKLNGDKAVVTRNVEIDPTYIAKAEDSILKTLKLSKDWGFDIQSQLQLLKVASIDHEIKGSSELSYQVKGAPLTPQETLAGKQPNPMETVSLGIGVGEITVKGNNFELMKELAENVDFSGTGLKKLNFKIQDLGKIDWEVKFNYYIKTKDGGIGSSSTTSLSDSAVKGTPQSQQVPVINK